MNILKMKKIGIFLGGVFFGIVGVKIFLSDCVKKICICVIVGVLKVKDFVFEIIMKI